MFRISRSQPWPAEIDLETIRETLTYMRDDTKRVPGLESVANALDATLSEIAIAERRLKQPKLSPVASRFLPRRTFGQ